MPKSEKARMTAEEGEAVLLEVLSRAPEGLTRLDAQRRAGLTTISTSTVLRWLNELVARGLVHAQGETRSRRYSAVRDRLAPTPEEAAQDGTLRASPEGEDIRRRVNQAIGARLPASYVRGFLDDYHANETFYLPASMREQLHALGRTTNIPQPGGTYARQIYQRLLIDLSWNSSRLEGNTYSLLDTERLLVGGMPLGGNDSEQQMIWNHKLAIEWLVEEVGDATLRVRSPLLRNLHALLMENLVGDRSNEGRVRTMPVAIGNSTFIPLAVPQQLEECLTQIAFTADAITDPFEQSFFLLVHIPYLQPFIDGNKRTARLAANVPLMRDNLRPLTFVDVPQRAFVDAILGVYELRRVDLLRDIYLWSYERSSARYAAVQQSLGEPDPFRLAHRALIKETVASLVREGLLAEDIEQAVEPFARRLGPGERPRFFAVVEAEMRGLHDGNYGRFGLRPSEFAAWDARRRG